MLKNYIKMAWRNLYKNKAFSIINLLGLAVGITCTLLILLWIQDELNFDKHNVNYASTYEVMINRDFNGHIVTDNASMLPLSEAIKKNFPEIKNAVTVQQNNGIILTYGDKKFRRSTAGVIGDFFKVFTFKLLAGNTDAALQPGAVAINQSTAIALFGKENPIDKVIRFDNSVNKTVKAVYADAPHNATIQLDAVFPQNTSDPGTAQALTNWVNCFSQCYFRAADGFNAAQFDKKLDAFVNARNTEKGYTMFTFPMSKWHLYSNFENGKNTGGIIDYVHLFSIIAGIILLIACVNFMNLSTSRSEKRAKEVGIRKTLGSGKGEIIIQFFCETLILSLIAFMLALGIVYTLLPSFNTMVDKQLVLPVNQPIFWLVSATIIIVTGLIAGSYPSLYLSSFAPVKVLKGTFLAGKKASVPRKVLVVGQFVISILLISATLIIYRQMQYVKKRDLDYNPDNLIMVNSSESADKNYKVIKQELLQSGKIEAVTHSSGPMTDIWFYTAGLSWATQMPGTKLIIGNCQVAPDYCKTIGTKIIQGREFRDDSKADTASLILNQAAVKTMVLKNPVGSQIRWIGRVFTIIGVTENVVMNSPYAPVDPMMMQADYNHAAFIDIRLKKGIDPQAGIETMKGVFTKYSTEAPFEYQFVDEAFGRKFTTENLISKLTNLFAGLAIFICCLGLSGLAAYTIEKRYREIGIRKVLGASVQQMLLMISKEFIYLIGIAFVIAIPLTWWGMHKWLQSYAYRIEISIWMFVIVGIVVLLLTLLTVCLNAMKAALANPIKSLRSE